MPKLGSSSEKHGGSLLSAGGVEEEGRQQRIARPKKKQQQPTGLIERQPREHRRLRLQQRYDDDEGVGSATTPMKNWQRTVSVVIA